MMHGITNTKICLAEQAKKMYQFKNIKARLYKTNAAIWYNKTCKHKGLTPNYINITISGHNERSKKTQNIAIRHRLNQEIKFLYAKKQHLNEKLYGTHLECMAQWPTLWQLIQTAIDSKLHHEMEQHYTHLNRKLDHILHKQTKENTRAKHIEGKHQFYTRIKNLTKLELTQEEKHLLNYGMNYSIERSPRTYAESLAAETERAIRLLDPNIQGTYRHLAAKKLKLILSTTNHKNTQHKRQLYILKNLRDKLTKESAIITRADKGKTVVIINTTDYENKVHTFLTDNFQTLATDPTNTIS